MPVTEKLAHQEKLAQENKTDLIYRPTKTETKKLKGLMKARKVLAEKRAKGLIQPKSKKVTKAPKSPTTKLGKAISAGMKKSGKKPGRKSKAIPKPIPSGTYSVFAAKPQVKLGSRTRRPSLNEVAKAINVLERAGLL